MKKFLACVLAVVLTLSLGAVAFAKEVEAENTTAGTTVDNDEDKKYELGFGDLGGEEDATPDKPGAVYYYTIMDENDDSGMLTDDDIAKHLTVSIKESGDKMIDSYAIVKQNGVYKVKVVTKETYLTDETEATWTITLKKDSKYTIAQASVDIIQQWAEICDNNIEEDDYGEAVYTVDLEEAHNGAEGASYDNYTDDINIEALAVIGSDVDYAELYFEDTMFWYSVKNSSKTTVNVYYETSNQTMATTYEDADLEMIFFPGAPEFDYTGILHAPADEDAYVYAVIDGKLVSDKFDWDEDSECWEYSTRAIEGVVVSDIALDVSLYNATVDNSSDPSASSDTDKDNPDTGAVDYVNMAVALGIVSLAAAGAVALKR
ncbi:MAG: hypothetical protein PUI40_10605 [Oscillospiraceae bacterium]|nr:hypothetical protein [Oscillospiraceae bacterium]MDD7042386.1 hypothetical protein [Oscillospiraceae bacterium]MDY2610752.1 hypothetical protein [Oscillospiraceae bacterium]